MVSFTTEGSKVKGVPSCVSNSRLPYSSPWRQKSYNSLRVCFPRSSKYLRRHPSLVSPSRSSLFMTPGSVSPLFTETLKREKGNIPPKTSRWTFSEDVFRSLFLWILTLTDMIFTFIQFLVLGCLPDSENDFYRSLRHYVRDTWFRPHSSPRRGHPERYPVQGLYPGYTLDSPETLTDLSSS